MSESEYGELSSILSEKDTAVAKLIAKIEEQKKRFLAFHEEFMKSLV